MTRLAYPRLADSEALLIRHRVLECAAEPSSLSELVQHDHPAAKPVPTGARIATQVEVRSVRSSVVDVVSRWVSDGRTVPRDAVAAFDLALGRVLNQELNILPADAAHQETWNFLSAVVFPDIVWARFPTLHEDRFLGTDRNVLRRAWFRYSVLGDLMDAASAPLGEDELVGLLERTALARNRRLARAIAARLMRHSGDQARSHLARQIYKSATHYTGPLLLDVLTDDELERLVDSLFTGDAWPGSSGHQSEPTRNGRHRADVSFAATESDSRPSLSTGDLVREFHFAMEGLFARTFEETGYRASKFLSMITDLGGLEAARRLVGSPNPSEGFAVLWELGRLDLTAEALVLDPRFLGLFPEAIVERAKDRLSEHGYV